MSAVFDNSQATSCDANVAPTAIALGKTGRKREDRRIKVRVRVPRRPAAVSGSITGAGEVGHILDSKS